MKNIPLSLRDLFFHPSVAQVVLGPAWAAAVDDPGTPPDLIEGASELSLLAWGGATVDQFCGLGWVDRSAIDALGSRIAINPGGEVVNLARQIGGRPSTLDEIREACWSLHLCAEAEIWGHGRGFALTLPAVPGPVNFFRLVTEATLVVLHDSDAPCSDELLCSIRAIADRHAEILGLEHISDILTCDEDDIMM
jgi:hypothetical protein